MGRRHEASDVVDGGMLAEASARIGPFSGVTFALARRPGGVFMHRRNAEERRALVEHHILFADLYEVTSWLDEDPVTRNRPVLREQLSRLARDLFELPT